MNDNWADHLYEWVNNKITLLSTPTGAVVAVIGFGIGIAIGRMILSLG